MIWWLLENWVVVAYVAAVAVAYAIGGWRLALGVGTLGMGVLLYRQGHKDAERQNAERTRETERKRQDAYDEIAGRDTDFGDVLERLRKGDY